MNEYRTASQPTQTKTVAIVTSRAASRCRSMRWPLHLGDADRRGLPGDAPSQRRMPAGGAIANPDHAAGRSAANPNARRAKLAGHSR